MEMGDLHNPCPRFQRLHAQLAHTFRRVPVSDSNACDSGSYTITLNASVNDAGGQALSQGHSYSIPITVNRTCDFTISVAPKNVFLPYSWKVIDRNSRASRRTRVRSKSWLEGNTIF